MQTLYMPLHADPVFGTHLCRQTCFPRPLPEQVRLRICAPGFGRAFCVVGLVVISGTTTGNVGDRCQLMLIPRILLVEVPAMRDRTRHPEVEMPVLFADGYLIRFVGSGLAAERRGLVTLVFLHGALLPWVFVDLDASDKCVP